MVHNGFPIDVAFGCSKEEIADWFAKDEARRLWAAIKFSAKDVMRPLWAAIKFSIFNGAEFDLNSMTFKDRE